MSQIIAVMSNQDFGLDSKTNQLIPQTEIIILVEKPFYKKRGNNIVRDSKVDEIRFKCTSIGLNQLIEQLQQAKENTVHFEQISESVNELIKNNPAPAGKTVQS